MKIGRLASDDQRLATDTVPPPEPPATLQPEEAELWCRIVLSMPGGWFTAENQPLLTQYVRHCCYADALATNIIAMRADITGLAAGSVPTAEKTKLIASLQRELRALQRSHAGQSAAMLAVATKLRLTQQSRYQANTAQAKTRDRPPDGQRPWDLPSSRLDQ
jgi:hypothetical protein